MTTGMDTLAQQRWYRIYRDKLDAREVLSHYGAINVTEQPGGDGTTELIHSCLIDRVEPHHTNGDASPSAALNVEKKVYVCYASRWKGDLLHLIMKMENCASFSESLARVSELMREGPEDVDSFRQRLVERLAGPMAYTQNLPSYQPTMMNGWRFTNPHPYLEERGITPEAYDLLELGYDANEVRITFPHYVQGKLVGFQKRVVPPRPGQWPGTVSDIPKYRSSSGFPKAETLYCWDRVDPEAGPIVVVESPMSVAKAYALGVPNVVATFGAAVSDTQVELLRRSYGTVIVWFDDDDGGRKGERRIVEALPMARTRVVEPEPKRDLGDYASLDEVMAKLATAMPAFLRRAQYDTEELRRSMH